MFAALSEGAAMRFAPVHPIFVPEIVSALVAISTFPATVMLAFGWVDPADTADQAPLIY